MSTQKLDELIPQLAMHKAEAGELKKVCDSENAEIKDIMTSAGLKKYETDGYTANYIESVRESMDEEKLLYLLHSTFTKKQLKEMKLIKTVEQVDENALENAIYNNLMGPDFVEKMANCKDKSVTVSLKITKKKG